MQPLSRRNAMLLGGLGVAGNRGRRSGTRLDAGVPAARRLLEPALTRPAELRSAGGSLALELEARRGPMLLAGRRATALGYNGACPGPTLRLRAGDGLADPAAEQSGRGRPTSMCTGSTCHRRAPGTIPLSRWSPGATLTTATGSPAGPPPGLLVPPPPPRPGRGEIFGGLFGTLVVEDTEPIAASQERVLLVSDISAGCFRKRRRQVPPDRAWPAGRAAAAGQRPIQPPLAPGRANASGGGSVNACVARYLLLRLDGQQHAAARHGLRPLTQSPEPWRRCCWRPGTGRISWLLAAAGDAALAAVPLQPWRHGRDDGTGRAAPNGGQAHSGHRAGDLSVVRRPGRRLRRRCHLSLPSADLRTAVVAAHRQLPSAAGAWAYGRRRGMMASPSTAGNSTPSRTDTTAAARTVRRVDPDQSQPDGPSVPSACLADADHRGHEAAAAGCYPVWRDVVNMPANGQVKVRIALQGFHRPLRVPLPHPGPRGPRNDGSHRGPLIREGSCQEYPPGVSCA